MYVPVLKNRQQENKFIRENNNLFNNQLKPLIEVLQLKIGRTVKTVSELIIEYDKAIGSPYFLDFFTFGFGEYKGADLNKVSFSLDIRDESKYSYEDLLLETNHSDLCIPVISIKEAREFLLDHEKIVNLIKKIQKHKKAIAVRIQSSLFEKYIGFIDPVLRDEDYLFYDINEENIEATFFDTLKIKELKTNYSKIILHSPRPSKLYNGSFCDGDFTDLIDNELRDSYSNYGFNGFSDYAGLKNVLPTKGSNGKGAALGLFYMDDVNAFFSIKNEDKTQGASGHAYVIKEAFDKYRDILDPARNCPAYEYIDAILISRGISGSWPQWKYITILRYISQIKQSTNNYL